MSTQTTIWAGCHQLPQQLPAGTNSPPSPTCNLLDKWNLFTPLPRHPLKTAKTFKWLCMKCCPASFCLKDSSLPLPPAPPHPLNNFCAKMKRRPQAVGAPGHEGLLQRRQGTGWVRHGRGPGGTAQFPGISSHRPAYLFRESDCIRFPDKVASSFAEGLEGKGGG